MVYISNQLSENFFMYKINVGKTNLAKSKVTKVVNVIFHILQHSLQISIQR